MVNSPPSWNRFSGTIRNNLFFGWDDRNGDDARLIINASLWLVASTTPQAPANDNFANSITLTGSSTSAGGSNALATKETGEPNHGGNAGGKSVWWSWTAPAAGNVTINTNGSNFSTLLGVYTGSSVDALTSPKSRPRTTKAACLSARLAPVTQALPSTTSGSTTKRIFASARRCGPM